MKTLRDFMNIINEAQKDDIVTNDVDLEDGDEELDEQFISKALPPPDEKLSKARSKIEQVIRNT